MNRSEQFTLENYTTTLKFNYLNKMNIGRFFPAKYGISDSFGII